MSETVARERSGHTAAADGQYLYVWGGYVVIIIIIIILNISHIYFTVQIQIIVLSND